MSDIQEMPWRKYRIDWRNTEEERDKLKDDVSDYDPLADFLCGDVSFPFVNILLFGCSGHGKSSVINTWSSVFQKKIFNVAMSGCCDHVLTKKLSCYPIIPVPGTNTRPTPLRFRLWDTQGIEPENLMSRENMRYVLQGNIPNKYPLDPSGNISTDMPGFKRHPELHERIHCVAIVQDASTVDAIKDHCPDVTDNIKEMQIVMNNLDVPQVVILNKIDKLSVDTEHDVSKAYYSTKIKACVAKVSEMFGVPKNMIFPMKNYESETETDSRIDVLALLALKGILNECDGYLFNHLDTIKRLYNVEERQCHSKCVFCNDDKYLH